MLGLLLDTMYATRQLKAQLHAVSVMAIHLSESLDSLRDSGGVVAETDTDAAEAEGASGLGVTVDMAAAAQDAIDAAKEVFPEVEFRASLS